MNSMSPLIWMIVVLESFPITNDMSRTCAGISSMDWLFVDNFGSAFETILTLTARFSFSISIVIVMCYSATGGLQMPAVDRLLLLGELRLAEKRVEGHRQASCNYLDESASSVLFAK